MTNKTDSLTTCSGLRGADFRMHAIDLNPGLVAPDQGEELRELLAFKELQAKEHWLLCNADYMAFMTDATHTVREIQRLSNITDMRSDAMLSADLLKEMGLWDAPEPKGQWNNARFIARFLVAFTRLYLHAKSQEGSQIREKKKYAFSPTH